MRETVPQSTYLALLVRADVSLHIYDRISYICFRVKLLSDWHINVRDSSCLNDLQYPLRERTVAIGSDVPRNFFRGGGVFNKFS